MGKGTLREPRPKRCANCEKDFIATTPRQVNCSVECRRERQYKLRVEGVKQGGPRRCPRCKQTKDPDEFTTIGLRCKACQAEYVREYAKANPRYRHSLTLRRHGLTTERFDAMLAEQGGGCAICRASEPRGHGVWHVDHDHACCPGSFGCQRCVRGLLCHFCNLLIGMAKDDPAVLAAAIKYLTGPEASASA